MRQELKCSFHQGCSFAWIGGGQEPLAEVAYPDSAVSLWILAASYEAAFTIACMFSVTT